MKQGFNNKQIKTQHFRNLSSLRKEGRKGPGWKAKGVERITNNNNDKEKVLLKTKKRT